MGTRAYLRIDPNLFEKKLEQGYPPGALAAFVACLCLAESQPERGSFRDERVLRVLLTPSYARWVPFLLEHKDLVWRRKRLVVDGWDLWQEGDLTVMERMKRYRARQAEGNGVTAGVTASVTPGVTAANVTDSDARASRATSGSYSDSGSAGPSRPAKKEITTEERRANLTEAVAAAQGVLDSETSTELAKTIATKALDKARAALEQLPIEDQQPSSSEDDVDFGAPAEEDQQG